MVGDMRVLLLITDSAIARQAVPWLNESTRRQNSELLVTNCVLNPVSVPGREGAWPLIEKPEKVRSVLESVVKQFPENNITLLDEINGIFPEQEVASIIKSQNIDVAYLPIDASNNIGSPDMQFGQELLQNVPCDFVLLDLVKGNRESLERIVIPMDLAESGNAIRRIVKLGRSIGKLVPLHISPDFGGDSQKIAARELELQLKGIGIEEEESWISPQVAMADGFHQGIIQTVQINDAVILSGMSIRLIRDLRLQLMKIRPQVAQEVAIGIFRPESLAAKNRFGRLGRRIREAWPDLTLADRVSLFDRIQGGARLTPDYIAMIGFSVLIASFGLLADNSSVVIGAMLVAPLMTPLIGMGLALAQGNLLLMKRSVLATVVGLIVGVTISFIIGLLIPLDELPLEILSRGDPNLVDMAIAFVSGMAAAYAVSRESVAESIVGVAIAAALVPPLACIGIMLAHNHVLETEGAVLLLVTNLAAIAMGAAFVFRRLGVPGTRTGHRSFIMIRRVSTILISLLLLLAIPLGFRMANQLAVGQIRPMSFRVSSRVKSVIEEQINDIDGLNIMFLGRSGSGHSKLIRVLLNADYPIPASMIKQIKSNLQKTLGEDTPVHIGVFQNAVIQEVESVEESIEKEELLSDN